MKKTPLDKITLEYDLPFPPHDFQEEALNVLAGQDCSLLQFKVGLGKTFTSTLAALYYSIDYDIEQILILCPPILIDQWEEFLLSVKGIPDIGIYRGTPTERKKMKMKESVIIASYNIFRGKGDYQRFKKMAKSSHLCIVADELSLKSLRGSTYKKLKEIVYRKLRVGLLDKPYHKLIALNATPISDEGQVYNWCSVFSPGLYGSLRLFQAVHADEIDNWGKVTAWKNVDLLHENMERFSVDTTKSVELPPLVETQIPYKLSPVHRKLYKEVEHAMLDNLPEDKIELAVRSMFSTLQKLVILPEEFGLDIESPVLEFIEGYLDQMDPDDGILIYSRHVAVSKMLAEKIPDCGAIYGGVSKESREETFAKLKSGELKRLVGNIDSLGVGLNLQMLNHVIFVEFPFRDDKLTQSLGRFHRQGQKQSCFASYPIAKGTLQRRIFTNLLKNGEDIDKVMRTKEDVRRFLS